jgi:4-hydroxy-tetrahydrodipicolinate synthase
MEPTRRDAIGLIGATATTILTRTATAAVTRELGSSSKTLFWVAAVTPCDRKLKFDPGAFKDILAWFKHNGADGIVVLGTTGQFPSFSVAERKQVAEVALKDKMGMNIIIGPGTSNFPETLELSQHAQDNGADGLLIVPPFHYKDPPTQGLVRYYSMLFDPIRHPDQSLSHTRD